MTKLVITGCIPDGSDANRTNDAVYGDGFYLRMDVAIQLALSGTEFWVKMPGIMIAKVEVAKSANGRLYLKTHPDAWIANNLGEICSGPKKLESALSKIGLRRRPSLATGFTSALMRSQNALAPPTRQR
jgi:hypothetical protein